MLQQTRVDTVIPYFNRFVGRFPTLRDLAAAPEEDVLKHWEGLGYYSRARNLQAAVREVVASYDAQVPSDKKAVSGLKGVGPYTAGAILSIAYNKPEPAVDGNVMRVLSRYFLIEEDIAKPATRAGMESMAASLIPEGEASDFNQALMELGAMVCTPKSPACGECPVALHCMARHVGRERELPAKSKAKPPKPMFRLAALVEGTGRHAGQVLVRQRPSAGLLAGMWELPHAEAPSADVWEDAAAGGQWLAASMASEEAVRVRAKGLRGEAQHVFTHLVWQVRVIGAELDGTQPLPEHYRWVGPKEFESYVWPKVFRKLLTEYFIAGHP